MTHDNTITGITLETDTENGVYICYIEDFSNELKQKIREMLSSIWHGAVDSEERQQFNYKQTLKRFLERYNPKTADTKKGMIGELLTHLLIPQHIDLEAISIMKNKEENSIRKGFDIVYCNKENSVWYCEVKSGGDTNNTEDIDTKNRALLNNAKVGIQSNSLGDRATLWDSVLIDVNSTVFNDQRKIDIKKLLDEHHPDTASRNMDRNVILSSVLYKSLNPKISSDNLREYKLEVDSENVFIGLIVFSIQKSTYKKIEDFLVEESNNQND
ncbi:MAG: DUF1837 domain-containing protein [Sphingobacteriia bacterium]|nr:DUF1837 domain-containing protein [Sphingobacteriia bacterium]